MLQCKFSGDYNSERIFTIGQYLTELCVEHLGFTFLAHPVCNFNTSGRQHLLHETVGGLFAADAKTTASIAMKAQSGFLFGMNYS